MQTSAALKVMLAPRSEYARLAAASGDASWRRALKVPALLAVMLGLLNATAAAGHVSASLVASAIVAWSFIPFLQLLTGAALIASAGTRQVTFPRALELLFAAHLPWLDHPGAGAHHSTLPHDCRRRRQDDRLAAARCAGHRSDP
jgi:hypothetical protein